MIIMYIKKKIEILDCEIEIELETTSMVYSVNFNKPLYFSIGNDEEEIEFLSQSIIKVKNELVNEHYR